MSRYIRHKKKDRNHKEIIDYFRQRGAVVDDVSDLAGLGYDCLVGYAEAVVMVEIKDGDKPPSARKLTASEEEARERWGAKFAVVENVEQAQGLLDSMAYYGRRVR